MSTQGGIAIGGGIYNRGTLNINADLLANPGGDACSLGTVDTDQYVFTSNGSCDPGGSTDHQSSSVATDLRNIKVNGVLEMVEPTAHNPAIGAIETSTGLCPPADQRGYVPVSGASTCDVGAYQTS
ncbi:MAG: choice-of-anchor Q domain-containing protein, partial [Ferrimicrobium sp.]